MNLSGETVLVTGASRGIGRAIVEELATRDVHVLGAGALVDFLASRAFDREGK